MEMLVNLCIRKMDGAKRENVRVEDWCIGATRRKGRLAGFRSSVSCRKKEREKEKDEQISK